MAQNDDSGDKTEQPTPKKLQDARKKGQVPKSKDLSSTVTLGVAAVLMLTAGAYAGEQLLALMHTALQVLQQPFALAAPTLARQALWTLLSLSAVVLLPLAAVGVLTEFLQVGPVFALDRVMPKLENLNPVEGIKRMFTLDALIELFKAVLKSVALLAVAWLVVRSLLPSLALLPVQRQPASLAGALDATLRPLLGWTLGLFALLALLDAVYQRWSFTKKMRMSRRDIRQEHKDNEGDPHVKQQRKQTQEEWSQRGAASAARQANVLVVNPTHVAIAIDYDRQTCPVPTIAAKGEDAVARAMREAAEDAGVPIVRNVPLARDLLARAEVGDTVPADLFDVIAEVVLWARQVREELQHSTTSAPTRTAPGLDLTRYADRRNAAAEDGAPEAAAPTPPHPDHPAAPAASNATTP
ncbi:MAG: type III secretion system export apparatus subunit SctU [Rubrivivax sp.]